MVIRDGNAILRLWGQKSTGGEHSVLQESMSTLGVPVMTKSSFIHTEHDIGECWRAQLRKSMIEAGIEERKLAIERSDYHQGVPAITVHVDGGWSKRSHKHSYRWRFWLAFVWRRKGNTFTTLGQKTSSSGYDFAVIRNC